MKFAPESPSGLPSTPDPLEFCGRPRDYRNPTPGGRYNLVVIGGGASGIAVAVGAATLGARVALVEQDRLGGSYLHGTGIPVEVLVRCSDTAEAARQPAHADWEPIRQQIRLAQSRLASSYALKQLHDLGIDVYFGTGRFNDRSHAVVEDQRLEFSRAVIATGALPLLPEWAVGLRRCVTTPADWAQMHQIPDRQAVIGDTPFGVAVAQVFARLGAKVTLYVTESPFLAEFDTEAAHLVKEALERDGVEIQPADRIRKAVEVNDRCVLQTDETNPEPFDRILLASGMRPKLDGLHLDQAGVLRQEQGLLLNDHLRTTNFRVYAAGEVIPGIEGADAATMTSQIVIANALFLATSRLSRQIIPRFVLTRPQVAQIGLPESDIKRGHLKVIRVPLDRLDGSVLDGDAEGFVKVICDHHGTVRGATVVSNYARQLAGLLTVIINHGPRLSALTTDGLSRQSLSGALRIAAENYRQTLLTPSVMKFLQRLLRWRR